MQNPNTHNTHLFHYKFTNGVKMVYLKYLRFFSTVLTNSLTLIRFLPGFLRYVLLSLFLP